MASGTSFYVGLKRLLGLVVCIVIALTDDTCRTCFSETVRPHIIRGWVGQYCLPELTDGSLGYGVKNQVGIARSPPDLSYLPRQNYLTVTVIAQQNPMTEHDHGCAGYGRGEHLGALFAKDGDG